MQKYIAIAVAVMLTAIAPVAVQAEEERGGMIMPIYGYDQDVDEIAKIADEAEDNDGELILIINPNNGPGSGNDDHYDDMVDELQDAGATVIGYISTAYGGKPIDQIYAEADLYDNYGVDGYFLDETTDSQMDYYEAADDIGGLVVSNPGAPVSEDFFDTADIVIVSENAYEIESDSGSWSDRGVLVHSTGLDREAWDDIHDDAAYVYNAPSGWLYPAENGMEQAEWLR